MKIEITNTQYPYTLQNGTIMTVTGKCGDGSVYATVDGGDGFEWLVTADMYIEVSDEPTFDPLDPPAFGELTDAQKVDIMLHEARCGGLEVWHGGSGKWLARSDVGRPIWESEARYRKKPQPVRDTVTLNVDGDGFIEGSVSFADKGIHTHRITFDTIDGKPVCDSIKMEEL